MSKFNFIYVGDMQPGSPRSYRYNPALTDNWTQAKSQIIALKPDFLLVGGDITRDGSIHKFELEEMKKDLDDLPFPVYVVPGNMDTGNKWTLVEGLHREQSNQMTDIELNITSRQLKNYSDIFGPLWWRRDHKGIRIFGFTDMLINSGLPEEDEFWNWAEKQIGVPQADRSVWLMHYALYSQNNDEPNWDISNPDHYLDWYFTVNQPGRDRLHNLFRKTNARLVLNGHIHCTHQFKSEDIIFQSGPSTAFSQWKDRWPDGDDRLGFLNYTVDNSSIQSTFVPLAKISERANESYGVGGHPIEEVRDYSTAELKDS